MAEPLIQDSKTAEFEVVKPENENDPRYFYLRNPIDVDGRIIKYLAIDPDIGPLTGRDHFAINASYIRKYADEMLLQTMPYQKYKSENYLSLVIAKLNKIAPEDLMKVGYKERAQLFTRAYLFQFSDVLDKGTPE